MGRVFSERQRSGRRQGQAGKKQGKRKDREWLANAFSEGLANEPVIAVFFSSNIHLTPAVWPGTENRRRSVGEYVSLSVRLQGRQTPVILQ